MIRTSLIVAALLAFACARPVTTAGERPLEGAQGRPNIVLILADDLGYGDLSCYGHPSFKTPRIDRLTVEGVRFTDFYVPVGFCAPSRAALLTGRYPFRSGMVFNPAPDSGIDEVGLPDSEVTLAEVLKSSGYATMAIGKWHLGHQPRFYPTRHGFDHYYGILYSNDMRPVQVMEMKKGDGSPFEKKNPVPFFRVAEDPAVQATLTQRYTQRALKFMEESHAGEKPFFLYLPHAMPHKPLAASEKFYKTTPSLYGDVMAELDWSVGQILDKLKDLGIEENTLVIFTSDNGPWYGGSTGGLRGMKGGTWEGGVRVPMIARWPGRIPAGLVCRQPAGIIDLFPTIVNQVADAKRQANALDGRDIWALMTQRDAPAPHDALFFLRGAQLAAVRSGPWKLHVRSPGNEVRHTPGQPWTDPRGPDGVTILAPYEQATPEQYPGTIGGDAKEMMLFNLEMDPAEQHDVAGQHVEVVERLKSLYDAMNAQVPRFTNPKGVPLKAPGPRPSE